MLIVFILDIIVIFPLAGAFYLLWRERRHFKTFTPFIVAICLSFAARFSELLIEYPVFHAAKLLDMPLDSVDLIVNTIGGFADVFAVLFLVIGFVQTIAYQRQTESTIENLETLLPICATCKKYRAADGTWYPIEQYLKDSGAPDLTHGICPDCAAKVKEEFKNLKK
jgi:hypothetical protein